MADFSNLDHTARELERNFNAYYGKEWKCRIYDAYDSHYYARMIRIWYGPFKIEQEWSDYTTGLLITMFGKLQALIETEDPEVRTYKRDLEIEPNPRFLNQAR